MVLVLSMNVNRQLKVSANRLWRATSRSEAHDKRVPCVHVCCTIAAELRPYKPIAARAQCLPSGKLIRVDDRARRLGAAHLQDTTRIVVVLS